MARESLKADSIPLERRELLRADEAAALFFGVSRSTWYAWLSDGWLPRPIVFLGHKFRWRRVELQDWCAAGCPQQSAWRWEPSRLGIYASLVQEVAAELAGLQDEKADLEREVVELRALADRLRR